MISELAAWAFACGPDDQHSQPHHSVDLDLVLVISLAPVLFLHFPFFTSRFSLHTSSGTALFGACSLRLVLMAENKFRFVFFSPRKMTSLMLVEILVNISLPFSTNSSLRLYCCFSICLCSLLSLRDVVVSVICMCFRCPSYIGKCIPFLEYTFCCQQTLQNFLANLPKMTRYQLLELALNQGT